MEVRQGANARDVKGYDTERLRNALFAVNPDSLNFTVLTYLTGDAPNFPFRHVPCADCPALGPLLVFVE